MSCESSSRRAPPSLLMFIPTRHTTVLEGTLYVEFAAARDDTLVVAVPAGGVYITPSNTAHFVLAKDGDTVYQESGTGPTRTKLIKQ